MVYYRVREDCQVKARDVMFVTRFLIAFYKNVFLSYIIKFDLFTSWTHYKNWLEQRWLTMRSWVRNLLWCNWQVAIWQSNARFNSFIGPLRTKHFKLLYLCFFTSFLELNLDISIFGIFFFTFYNSKAQQLEMGKRKRGWVTLVNRQLFRSLYQFFVPKMFPSIIRSVKRHNSRL